MQFSQMILNQYKYDILLSGINGEPLINQDIQIILYNNNFNKWIRIDLSTDNNGRIHLPAITGEYTKIGTFIFIYFFFILETFLDFFFFKKNTEVKAKSIENCVNEWTIYDNDSNNLQNNYCKI